ncbi:MAG: AraC family transcriptional regulator [Paenibacillus sp.]|nr:AraC family transcriptional regulator [Paenibacillus sp.]
MLDEKTDPDLRFASKEVPPLNSVFEQFISSPLVPYIRQADFAVRYPYRLGERRLLDYLFIYVQEGSFHLTVEGREYRLRDGDFCLIQPGELHSFAGTTNTITPFAHMDLFYNPLRQDSFPTRPGQVDLSEFADLKQPKLNDFSDLFIPVQFYPKDANRFRDTFLKAIALWTEQQPIAQLEAQQLAAEAVLMLLKSYTTEQGTAVKSGQLHWVTSYCSLHLAERLTVDQLARQAQMSTSQFTAYFRRTFGQSPYQYILRLRIQHAQELLVGSTHSLGQIAELCGFGDIHHFSKIFKKCTDQSPLAYRRSQTE